MNDCKKTIGGIAGMFIVDPNSTKEETINALNIAVKKEDYELACVIRDTGKAAYKMQIDCPNEAEKL